jgi:hypothetical protein
MHGFKLLAIFVGICFGAFLMSLDIFVIATVLLPPPLAIQKSYDLTPTARPSHPSRPTSRIRHNWPGIRLPTHSQHAH